MNFSLFTSTLIFYGILILANVPAGFLNLNFGDGTNRLWYAPPGYVIPIVWFILFTLYGIARYKLINTPHESLIYWLYVLAFLCATYAYYTIGLAKWTGISALWFGLIGNVIVIIFASFVTYLFWSQVGQLALAIAPTVIWTIYATLIVIGEMKLEKII